MSDLPFQWDDGVFLSPFVPSGDATAAAVAHELLRRYLLPAAEAHTEAEAVSLRLLDLGCGDGAALFGIARCLRRAWGVTNDTAAASVGEAGGSGEGHRGRGRARLPPLSITATGIDLDEALVLQAREAAAAAAANDPQETAAGGGGGGDNAVAVTYTFLCEDISAVDLDRHFPKLHQQQQQRQQQQQPQPPPSPPPAAAAPSLARHTSGGGGADTEAASSSQTPTAAAAAAVVPTVLFLYLLPDALAALEETLTDILKARATVVVSNRWDIKYFAPYQKNSKQEAMRDQLYLYSYP